MSREYDMNWSVKFEITIDGSQASFFDLDDEAQEYLCEQIKNGFMHGTTGGVRLWNTEYEE